MNKNEFDESEHPRNKGGKFIKKNKGYDSRDNFGQTVSRAHKTYRQNASYAEIIAADRAERERAAQREQAKQAADSASRKKSKPNYAKHKGKIQSMVYDRISSVRNKLIKDGFAIINVNDFHNSYTVKLYGADNDYEFDIIGIRPIK